MGRKWRVGLLGLGHWYSAYGLVRALREYSRAELVGVAEPDEAHRLEFAGTFGVRAHATFGELIARDDVDIVQIAAPVAEIPACTILSARAGKHIVLGKPMAMNRKQADEMVEAVEAAGVKVVCFQGLFRLGQAWLKRRIDAGEIGDVAVIHDTARWSIAEDWFHSGRPGWFADPAQVPGGAFIDEGIYSIERVRWLAGSEVAQVEARVGNLVHKDIGVEDWGLATLGFESGVVATVEASWTISAPRKSGPSPKANSANRLEVVGTQGEIIVDGLRVPGVAVLGKGAPGWAFERSAGDHDAPAVPGPLDHLVDCIEQGREPVAPIEEARRSFLVALAAYEAARKGRAVRVRL